MTEQTTAEVGATCAACRQSMLIADGCTLRIYTVNGIAYRRLPYVWEETWGPRGPEAERCNDCGARLGHLHHPGCDLEECPKCGQQVLGGLGCECGLTWTSEKEE